MRNVIITVALVIICAAILVGQGDVNEMQRESRKAKYLADNMANAASICIDLSAYSSGHINFDYEKGNDLALEILQKSGYYDDQYKAKGRYFTEDAVVDIYYFDESLVCRHYKNGVLLGTFAFSFDGRPVSEWAEELEEVKTALSCPCVVTVYCAGKPRLSLVPVRGIVKIQKTSVYEYKY